MGANQRAPVSPSRCDVVPGHLCRVSVVTLWLMLSTPQFSPLVKLHHDAGPPLWRQAKRERFTIGNLYASQDLPYIADFDDRVKTRGETKPSSARRSKAFDNEIARLVSFHSSSCTALSPSSKPRQWPPLDPSCLEVYYFVDWGVPGAHLGISGGERT